MTESGMAREVESVNHTWIVVGSDGEAGVALGLNDQLAVEELKIHGQHHRKRVDGHTDTAECLGGHQPEALGSVEHLEAVAVECHER